MLQALLIVISWIILLLCYVCNFTCCILLDDYLDYIQDYYGEVVHEELIRVSIYYI